MFKERQFQVFKQTDEYKKIKADLQKTEARTNLLTHFYEVL